MFSRVKAHRLRRTPGQAITVKSFGTNTIKINEVEVHGTEIECPFNSFSDSGNGNFEIELSDPSGIVPKRHTLPALRIKRTFLIRLIRNSLS